MLVVLASACPKSCCTQVENAVRLAVHAALLEELTLRSQGMTPEDPRELTRPAIWAPPTWPTTTPAPKAAVAQAKQERADAFKRNLSNRAQKKGPPMGQTILSPTDWPASLEDEPLTVAEQVLLDHWKQFRPTTVQSLTARGDARADRPATPVGRAGAGTGARRGRHDRGRSQGDDTRFALRPGASSSGGDNEAIVAC